MTTQRHQMMLDIITTAIESNTLLYWAECRHYRLNSDNYITSFEIRDWYDNDDKWHVVNSALISKGIKKVKESNFEINDDILKEILLADQTDGKRGELDSDSSDVIIQAALFGEIKYS